MGHTFLFFSDLLYEVIDRRKITKNATYKCHSGFLDSLASDKFCANCFAIRLSDGRLKYGIRDVGEATTRIHNIDSVM